MWLGVIETLLRACWQTAIKTPTSKLGAVDLHFLTFNFISETLMQLENAAVLFYMISYLTTSTTASLRVFQEAGNDTNLLALFAAIRRISQSVSQWICVCVCYTLRSSSLCWPVFSLEVKRRGFRTAEQPSSSWPTFVFAAASLERCEISDHQVLWTAARRRRPWVTACSFLLSLLWWLGDFKSSNVNNTFLFNSRWQLFRAVFI